MPHLPKNLIKRKGRPGFYYRRMVNGKRVTRFLSRNYSDAVLLLKRMDAVPLPEITVRDAAKQWLALYVAVSRNPKGQRLAKARVEQYLEPFLGHYLVARLSPDHLRGYRLWLEKKVALQTVSHLLSDARSLLRWAEEVGYVSRSPFPKRIMPRIQQRPPDRLTDTEVERICALPDPHGFVCRFLLATGLRWAEACRAQTSHVEGGMLIVSQTKSGRLRRVPIGPEFTMGRVGRFVPYSEKSPGSFARVVQAVVPGFHVHQARHTFACQWLEWGGSLPALQQILGHASIETTQVYARLSDDMVKLEAGRLATRVATSNS